MSTSNLLENFVNRLSEETEEEKKFGSNYADKPSVAVIEEIVDLTKQIVFPGYFDTSKHTTSRYYYIGVLCEKLLCLLKIQIRLSFKTFKNIDVKEPELDDLTLKFIDRISSIKHMLYTDVDAMFHSDPAVTAYSEIILCYPVVQVMLHYRIAHELWKLQIPVIPRIITELAHSRTGIDIHPGAQIDEYFSIDHGTGVVIGETCIIGKHVTIYQGVTLGAKNFIYNEEGQPMNVPRHPILEDNVTVYSNSSILGRITIGHDTIIGGNVWLTSNVKPNSRILQRKAVPSNFTGGLGI